MAAWSFWVLSSTGPTSLVGSEGIGSQATAGLNVGSEGAADTDRDDETDADGEGDAEGTGDEEATGGTPAGAPAALVVEGDPGEPFIATPIETPAPSTATVATPAKRSTASRRGRGEDTGVGIAVM